MVKSNNRLSEASEILRILIENRNERFSIRKLSLLRKINYKSGYNAVMKLKDEGIVDLKKIGNTTECNFNNSFSSRVFEIEFNRRENLLRNKNIKVLYSRLEKMNFPFIALLFGSFVKGKSNKFSDIDLLIISEHKKEFEKIVSLIPLDIHLTIINYNEFIIMAKSKEFSVVSEVLNKNLILNGIEEYYRLIKNVR